MSEPVHDDDSLAVDLTGVPLHQIARLCAAVADDLSPEEASRRPALRRALRRVRETAGQAGEAFAGHGEQPPPLLPLPPPEDQ
jgi:hypothetical protein